MLNITNVYFPKTRCCMQIRYMMQKQPFYFCIRSIESYSLWGIDSIFFSIRMRILILMGF